MIGRNHGRNMSWCAIYENHLNQIEENACGETDTRDVALPSLRSIPGDVDETPPVRCANRSSERARAVRAQ